MFCKSTVLVMTSQCPDIFALASSFCLFGQLSSLCCIGSCTSALQHMTVVLLSLPLSSYLLCIVSQRISMDCWAYEFWEGCPLQLLKTMLYIHSVMSSKLSVYFAAWCRRQTWLAALSVCQGLHIW